MVPWNFFSTLTLISIRERIWALKKKSLAYNSKSYLNIDIFLKFKKFPNDSIDSIENESKNAAW